MATDTTTKTRDYPQTLDGAPDILSSGPDRDPSPRRVRLVVIGTVLAALAFVAILGGAVVSRSITRSPNVTVPAQPAAPVDSSVTTGENPNQREGRVPIAPPVTTGENPNQREGRVPGRH